MAGNLKHVLLRCWVPITVIRIGVLSGTSAFAQLPARFEAASIKPNNDAVQPLRLGATAGRFTAENVTLGRLIQMAFGVRDVQIAGGPAWINSSGFDVVAKAADNRTIAIGGGNGIPMLQSLLEERFMLKVHRETREQDVYKLTIAKNGPKMPQTKGGCAAVNLNNPAPPLAPDQASLPACGVTSGVNDRGHLNIIGMSIENVSGAPFPSLKQRLSQIVGRPVIDNTGLTGVFDVHLVWNPEDIAVPSDLAAGPSLFTALQDQLGLKLEAAKGPIEMLIIDHVEMPSEN